MEKKSKKVRKVGKAKDDKEKRVVFDPFSSFFSRVIGVLARKKSLKSDSHPDNHHLLAGKDDDGTKVSSKSSSSSKSDGSSKKSRSIPRSIPPKKKKATKLKNRQLLRKYLDKAGFEDVDEFSFIKNVFKFVIFVCLVLSFFALILASIGKPGLKTSVTFLVWIWTSVFAGVFILSWVLVYFYLDIRIMNRTAEIEAVLPDFLQLTSANISAGMSIDRALWFAVRPNFGILAKEMEEVAKSTISGDDLGMALMNFTKKYDSKVLRRSMSLLLEGMNAGGEIADLLSKISLNIQNSRILKKEMAANVTTYVIFIGFAAAVAAPILFALSGQLLIIIQQIMSIFDFGSAGGAASSFSMALGGEGISKGDFHWFAAATLSVTALFSGMILSVIRKGSIKEGWRFIPMIIVVTLVIYFLASLVLGSLLGGIVVVG